MDQEPHWRKRIEVLAEGLQVRDFTFVDDVTDAILLAALSIKVRGKGDFGVIPFPEDPKPIDIDDHHADCGKTRADLNWTLRLSLEPGHAKNLQYHCQFTREHL
jgi:UDP-glucose 4-epimerase